MARVREKEVLKIKWSEWGNHKGYTNKVCGTVDHSIKSNVRRSNEKIQILFLLSTIQFFNFQLKMYNWNSFINQFYNNSSTYEIIYGFLMILVFVHPPLQ